ncbi:hypothetical protein [Arthrobacter sp. A2-55]|uniref:hypothetical protein n=1 Tax=Arthrobacter sp. A2-55 TaxID=2897337 RepID=UPI0021CD412C|nr:hypothetical protein [Arthrobacter sp. A2-55]MCU6481315.1 hypothetical protein [Arthrobacter sp. A2-55]
MSTSALTGNTQFFDNQFGRAMQAERDVWTGWMERLLRNGPRDEEAASAVASSSIRYNGLASMRRNFGDTFFDPDFRGYEAKTKSSKASNEGTP